MSDKPTNEKRAEGAVTDDAFDIATSGYTRDQVDAYVQSTESTIADLRGQVTELERRLQALRHRADERSSQPYARLGGRVENLLRLAEDEAADLAGRARREYEQVVAEARRNAAETVRVATSDARETRAKVDAYREEALAEVERRRDELGRREDELEGRIDGLRAALDATGPVVHARVAGSRPT